MDSLVTKISKYFFLTVICLSAFSASEVNASTVLSLNFPLTLPASQTSYGVNGLVITDPSISLLPRTYVTTEFQSIELYVGLNGGSPEQELSLVLYDNQDCQSEIKTGEDYGLQNDNIPKLINFVFSGSECFLYPDQRVEFRLSIGSGSGYYAKGINGSPSFRVSDINGFEFYNDLSATTTYQTRIQSVDIETEYGLEPESLQYERITGVSNPGTFQNSNLTSGIGGSALDGKYITKFAINARTNGTQSNVLLTVYENGSPVSSVVVPVTTQSTAIWTDFVLPSPIFVENGADFTIRPTLDSGDNGYPYGEAGGTGSWNLRVYGNEQAPLGVNITANYLLNTSEIIATISEKNPTLIEFELSKRPATTTSSRGEAINNTVNGTSSVTTQFDDLTDGTYDVLAKFSNAGCTLGLSQCPFPLAYVYTSFTVAGNEVTSVGTNEVYDNVVVAPSEAQYEDCGITNIGGCINNSLRFLFIPSQSAVNELLETKNTLDTRIPFVYVSDIRTVADEIFNTAQAETLDVTLDLGFGMVPLINEDMIENAPQASLIRQLLSYMLWIAFALGAYRMALGIHNKETAT